MGLPKELEQAKPSFHHTEADEIPHWAEGSLEYKLIAGELMGKKSPVPVYSKLYFLEIKSKKDAAVNIGSQLFGEVGMYILEGSVGIENNTYSSKQLLIAKNPELCTFEMAESSTVYLFGGEPFPEERYIFWNFVNSDKDMIEQAKENWHQQNHEAFPHVPGDEEEYVPLPKAVLNSKLSR